jgi:hypothetical protein
VICATGGRLRTVTSISFAASAPSSSVTMTVTAFVPDCGKVTSRKFVPCVSRSGSVSSSTCQR